MSPSEKETLLERFVKTEDQRLFHVPRFPTKQEVYDFISVTSTLPTVITKKKKDRKKEIVTTPDAEDIVYGEDKKTAPNRMIVFDDLMTDAFGNKDNESTMNLITMKLSHHNNLSVLIVCHELYPKGKSSMLFREQFNRCSPTCHS